ncbi:MAG: hypothetical protein Aurels2KO_18300 [Aureliella sp.]
MLKHDAFTWRASDADSVPEHRPLPNRPRTQHAQPNADDGLNASEEKQMKFRKPAQLAGSLTFQAALLKSAAHFPGVEKGEQYARQTAERTFWSV